MATMLKIEAIGNLGKDPESRFTPAGQQVVSFSIACTRTWTTDGQKHEETTWLRITAWGKLAETCHTYLKKGRSIYVEGRLQVDAKTGGPRIFERGDGTPGASFEVTAEKVIFLGGAGGNGGDAVAEGSVTEDEIPF